MERKESILAQQLCLKPPLGGLLFPSLWFPLNVKKKEKKKEENVLRNRSQCIECLDIDKLEAPRWVNVQLGVLNDTTVFFGDNQDLKGWHSVQGDTSAQDIRTLSHFRATQAMCEGFVMVAGPGISQTHEAESLRQCSLLYGGPFLQFSFFHYSMIVSLTT